MKHITRTFLVILLFFAASSVWAQSNKWRDIYKVKKKDTIFGIAKKYGLSIVDLMEANPEMKQEGYQLKKGTTLFIPFEKKTETQPAAKPVGTADGIRDRAIRIGVMLPLHDVDGDGRRMVEYYRGILMACDSLKREGISTDIHAWNVDINADIRQTLLADGASRCDIIFGPLYTKQLVPLAEFCRTYDIKLVIPFSISGNEVERNPQIYQVYQPQAELNADAVNAFVQQFKGSHPIIVDCNDSTSRKGAFTSALRQRMEAQGIQYSITNLTSPDDVFAKAFLLQTPNVIILNTGRSPQLNAVLGKLDRLTAANPTLSVSLYGYTEWLMYTKVYLNYYHKYDTHIPTTFYYNNQSVATQNFENSYTRWFKQPMQAALPRFGITGYDQAQFFLRGLYYYGKTFKGTRDQNTYRPLQTPLVFKPTVEGGGMKNQNFMLIHYTRDQRIEAINY